MGAKYYESELAYLRDMGREFAQVHPSTAGLLAERGSDPDVERLLQGFAFLSARIRERIDDAVPEVVDGLMQLLLPHYLRPIPACSIIEFSPSLKRIRGLQRIARGTRVVAQPRPGVSCEFRTTSPVDLLPLVIRDAVLKRHHAARPVLTLSFETTEVGCRALVGQSLRLLLSGDHATAATLYLWFSRYVREVRLVRDGQPVAVLGPSAVSPAGFDPSESMLPWPALSNDGYRVLQEYFILSPRFTFVDIAAFTTQFTTETFSIEIEFDRPPEPEQRIGIENFRLFCTPVVNLFDVAGEPIRPQSGVYEHLVRAESTPTEHAEVYDVRSVVGIRKGDPDRRVYRPFVGFSHENEPGTGGSYTLRTTSSPIDDGIDVYLSLGGSQVNDDEVLSVDLTCTNRSLPTELQIGEICTSPRGLASPAPFRNVVPLSVPVRPKVGSELHWRFLSHLAIGRRSLTEPEILRTLLSLYNFQRETSPSAGRNNDRLIASIRAIDSSTVTRTFAGAPVRGSQTRISIDQSNVGAIGEAFLFGCVLDELFGSHVPLNSFNELVVQLHPSEIELCWPARSGRLPML